MHLRLADKTVMGLSRPAVMGILNVTPDSFSDGGRYVELESAVEHGVRMIEEGAELIDVGGESTRPGSVGVEAKEQIRRVVPVIRKLREYVEGRGGGGVGTVISVDTQSVEVAEAALSAGATMVNDVSAGAEEGMLELVAKTGVPVVLMHRQGLSAVMQDRPVYGDVVGEVCDFLKQRVEAALSAGVLYDRIVVDPGIGFGKTLEHNLKLLRGLSQVVELGYVTMLGASRKRSLRAIYQQWRQEMGTGDGGAETEMKEGWAEELVGATCATTVKAVEAGVHLVRVHDVRANVQAAAVAWAIKHQRQR